MQIQRMYTSFHQLSRVSGLSIFLIESSNLMDLATTTPPGSFKKTERGEQKKKDFKREGVERKKSLNVQ